MIDLHSYRYILWAHNKPLDGEDANEYMRDHNYILTVEKDNDTVM